MGKIKDVKNKYERATTSQNRGCGKRAQDIKHRVRVMAMTVLVMMAAVVTLLPINSYTAYAYVEYTTESFDVDVVVTEDNVYHVNESITVDFTGSARGIFLCADHFMR